MKKQQTKKMKKNSTRNFRFKRIDAWDGVWGELGSFCDIEKN